MSLTVQKYTKKPVTIEAIQLSEKLENYEAVKQFCGNSISFNFEKNLPDIETLEGTMTVSKGDYIIKGLKGEFYPCKPDIFEMSYNKEIVKNPNTYRVEHFEYDKEGNILYHYRETVINPEIINS